MDVKIVDKSTLISKFPFYNDLGLFEGVELFDPQGYMVEELGDDPVELVNDIKWGKENALVIGLCRDYFQYSDDYSYEDYTFIIGKNHIDEANIMRTMLRGTDGNTYWNVSFGGMPPLRFNSRVLLLENYLPITDNTRTASRRADEYTFIMPDNFMYYNPIENIYFCNIPVVAMQNDFSIKYSIAWGLILLEVQRHREKLERGKAILEEKGEYAMLKERALEVVGRFTMTNDEELKRRIYELRQELAEKQAGVNKLREEISKKMLELDGAKSAKEALETKINKEVESLLKIKHIENIDMQYGGMVFGFNELEAKVPGKPYSILIPRTKAIVNFESLDVRFLPADDDVETYRGFWGFQVHPHVSEIGEPCWGSVSATIAQLIEAREFAALASMLISYLQIINIDDVAGANHRQWPAIDENGDLIALAPSRVCEHCGREEGENGIEIYICDDCNEYVCSECSTYVDRGDYLICPACYDENYARCGYCGVVEHHDYVTYLEDVELYYCDRCYEEHAAYCVGCENDFTIDNMVYSEYNDGWLCRGCSASVNVSITTESGTTLYSENKFVDKNRLGESFEYFIDEAGDWLVSNYEGDLTEDWDVTTLERGILITVKDRHFEDEEELISAEIAPQENNEIPILKVYIQYVTVGDILGTGIIKIEDIDEYEFLEEIAVIPGDEENSVASYLHEELNSTNYVFDVIDDKVLIKTTR